MKTKFISLLFIFALNILSVYGQENKRFNLEEFKKKRTEFLKEEIGLTKSEAKAFFPLSNELMQKKYELNKVLIDKNRDLRKKGKKTNADYEEIVKKTLEIRIKEAKLEKEYYEKFKAILSPEKIYKYQIAEMKLAKNMVNNRERPNKETDSNKNREKGKDKPKPKRK